MPEDGEHEEQRREGWMLHVDGSSTSSAGGEGILLQGLGGVQIEVAAKLDFPTTNNEAEYEALAIGLKMALDAGVRELDVYTDSQLIPREENTRADALSKFGVMITGVKETKIVVVVQDRASTEEVEVVQSEEKSWKNEIEEYLLRETEPDDQIAAKRLKFRANRFTLINGELYRRLVEGLLLKCLSPKKAHYVLRKIHEGSCGNHSGNKLLTQRVIRQGYFWPTLVKDAMELAKKCENCQKYATLIHSPATRWNLSKLHVHLINGE
ncbi:UNVERIFIED_CONTAM: hypothetical protein Slati_3497800 [Sesamum latifolium]|uniref:RNase H type-1 domain-containing protein n=1 Tax=Sesamum latifolium TaxID=2727402 RepID=A0AAW2UI49_9LAMI